MPHDETESAQPLSGWEASAPTQDTALRQFILAQCAFQRLTGESLGATILETDAFIAVDSGRAATMLNFTILKQPLFGAELDDAMAPIQALYERPGTTGFAALYSPLPTADLSPWGWTLAGHPPLQLRQASTPTIDTSRVQVTQVRSDADRVLFEQIMIDGFEFEEMRGQPSGSLMTPALFDDPRFAGWIGSVEGAPVSAAASIVEAGIVNVTMVATVPSGRRKGGALAVTQAAARPDLGLPGVLFSSDDGRPVYERLGYVPILRGSFWYRNR
jgi:hypothetical protein